MAESKQIRYAAKLLFQYRVIVNGDSGKRRTCEERTVLLRSNDPQAALRAANSKGKSTEYRFRNSDGNPVRFEFIGIRELISLSPECEEDEVWYDIKELLLPMERRSKLIPRVSDLSVFRDKITTPPAK